MKAAREAWFEAQPALDPARRVFLDETWTAINMPAPADAVRVASGWKPGSRIFDVTAALGSRQTIERVSCDCIPVHVRGD